MDHWARPMASSRDDHQLTIDVHPEGWAFVRCTCGWEWGDVAGMTLEAIERVAATAVSHDRSLPGVVDHP